MTIPGASAPTPPDAPGVAIEGLSARACIDLALAGAAEGRQADAERWLVRASEASLAFADWTAAATALAKVLPPTSPVGGQPLRVWVCNSYTTVQFARLLDLAGRRAKLVLDVRDGAYGQFRQEILDPDSALYAARPDVVVLAVHAEAADLPWFAADADSAVDDEVARWSALWSTLARRCSARIVMHNFAAPLEDPFGHLSARLPGSRAALLARLNARLGQLAGDRVAIVDCERLSAGLGKSRWFSPRYWEISRQACSLDALPLLARHTAAVLAASFGRAKKCIVLDLDNTLWGGVVGEDGVDGIRIGPESPEGRSYATFQTYLKQLTQRGILLAVSSKNNPDEARAPFLNRPDMPLKLDDFAVFRANWDSKPDNIRAIAAELGIGLDSLVFLDDSPVEREMVRQFLPEVEVPTLPPDPADYTASLAALPLFESSAFTSEDRSRTELYRSRGLAAAAAGQAATVDDFLRSLGMTAQLQPISEADLPRVVQLLAKTNQFNLTTRRLSAEQLRALMSDRGFVHLTLRLQDRFADHGLVGVIGAVAQAGRLRIDLWAMSCRVIGRTAEAAMLSGLLRLALQRRCEEAIGLYVPTAKNGPVEHLYTRLGFASAGCDATGARTYRLPLDHWQEPKGVIATTWPRGGAIVPREIDHVGG